MIDFLKDVDPDVCKQLLDALPVAFVMLDGNAKLVGWNAHFQRLTGYDSKELSEMTALDFSPWHELETVESRLREVFTEGYSSEEISVLSKDRELTPYFFSGRKISVEGRTYVVALGCDVSEQRRIKTELQQRKALLGALDEHSRDVTIVSDRDGIIRFASGAVDRALGYASNELTGTRYLEYVHPDDAGFVYESFENAIADGLPRDVPLEFRFRHRNGTYRDLSVTGGMIPDLGLVTNARDLTEQRAIEEEVQRLALYDSLTELANRDFLVELLESELHASRARKTGGLVFFLDVDRFKSINDALGHDFGDRLLKLVTERLRTAVPPQYVIARHGGDEFVVVVPGASMRDAENVGARLLDALTDPFVIEPHVLHVTWSAGVCEYPAHGKDAATLLRNADAAMYAAKGSGRNTLKRFSPLMSDRITTNLQLANDLHRALDDDQLELYYQPMTRIGDNSVIGYEALIRWHHPERGLVFPDEFIPLAEEVGLITRIGHFVLDRACRQLREWQDFSGQKLTMAINVSARQLGDEGFVPAVGVFLQRYGIAPECLELELTEGAFVSHERRVMLALSALTALGVRTVIDDFGTGYSNLGYLRRFNVRKVKLDRSFVENLTLDTPAAAIVGAVVSLARALNFTVLAEGIETRAELEAAREIGCDEAQGYLIGRPQPPGQFG